MGLSANIDLIILFFFLGALASALRSDLEIPEAISKFASLFLLLSLGLKGGHEVRMAEDLAGFPAALSLGLLSCVLIPVYSFFWLRRRLGAADAAAIACCYGSVSAVTYVTAVAYLDGNGLGSSGFMVAVMALMEIPAIVLGIYFYRRSRIFKGAGPSMLSLLSMKSVVLLLGGFAIGLAMDERNWLSVAPVFQDSFRGVLAFFLLDLGILAQRQFKNAWRHRVRALFIGCFLPLVHGSLMLVLAAFLGLEPGNQILLAVLAGSASYIAAPAALRLSVADANPTLYVALPLALTFPMNVVFGIPLYIELAHFLWAF